ncbi:DUF1501 domain-containing protein [Ferruginibacter yonginensis]|uniref:DUF1501 domain-containing protein n=1 Tax=Ferruginibacter yonginensis TaxID=1310416 RepID=A0ABV8QR79_9BACT
MKRRDFLKNTLPGIVLPTVINGFSLKSFAADSPLAKLLGTTDNDHVLVIVQLQGGNDGLNMVIPIDGYSNYFNARSNIAIPENSVLKLDGVDKTGLHPAMTGLRTMYNEGKLGIVQSVGYPQPNFSHFRATDIWMSASDSNQVITNGWGGRFLDYEYPNFPTGYPNSSMPDPLGIQIGSVTSLVFQGPSVSMGMSISNPTSFYNLISGVEDPAPNTLAGKELKYIRQVANQTSQYATVVKNAALNVTQQAPYPTNNALADQLKIVARLVKGGLKTKIYMVSYGSFDTHSLQTTTTDTTVGTHANLLKNVSDAIKAFQDDLKFLGVENRVMGLTFSEFGRRIKSNASTGTDHGAAAPLFVFGSNAQKMVHGNNPTIPANAGVNDNIPMQYDFRSVYASMLQDWMCVKNSDLQQIMLQNFQNIPLVKTSACNPAVPNLSGTTLVDNYPNPFTQSTTIRFTTSGGHTLVQIINTLGQVITTLVDREFATAGTYSVVWQSGNTSTGVYYVRFQNGVTQQVRTMVKVR